MKIKNTRPTPKSITHKKPTKISLSSNIKKQPKKTRYKPARYHNVRILYVLTKKHKVTSDKFCKTKTSVSILN